MRREHNPSDETTSYFSERENTKPGDLLGASPPQNTNKAPAHNAGSRSIHPAPPIPTRSDRKKLFYCAPEKKKRKHDCNKSRYVFSGVYSVDGSRGHAHRPTVTPSIDSAPNLDNKLQHCCCPPTSCWLPPASIFTGHSTFSINHTLGRAIGFGAIASSNLFAWCTLTPREKG